MKQHILINGADNFVGLRLQAHLAQSDWAHPVPIVGGDTSSLLRALPDAHAIAHCTVGNASAVQQRAASLYTALAHLAAPARVVHLSSMTVYGTAVGRVDEQTELRADLGAYSQAHRDAELVALRHPNVVILRPGAEYGPACPHWSGRIARLLLSHRLGDLGAAGDGCCNLTFIDDLVTAISVALRLQGIEGKSYNVALDYKPTWNEYFIRFARALGAVPVRRISSRRLSIERSLLAPPLKIAESLALRLNPRFSATPPPLTPSLLQLCAQEIRMDVSRAERVLGIRWTPFADGLDAAGTYYRHALERQ
jgi:nucleoside-diphosphate-sugar epimerase